MLDKKAIKKIQEIIAKYPKIKLVYFFGSRVKGKFNINSDYDFAIYIEKENDRNMANIKMKLMTQLMIVLKNEKVDIVILNQGDPTLNFEICRTGKLIYEKEPYRLILEPKIINEYFDYYLDLKKYNLTK
jgi:predicted nucleotidyltransferase